jgi:hypothetical protein
LGINNKGYDFLTIFFQMVSLNNQAEMVQVPQEQNWQAQVEKRINEAKDATYSGNEIDQVKILISYLLLREVKINIDRHVRGRKLAG